MRKIQDMQQTALVQLDQAVDVLGMTSKASELFVEQTAVEQRRLLKTGRSESCVERRRVADGAVRTVRNPAPPEPGKLQKGKENAGVWTRIGNWLLSLDSNRK